MAPLVDAVMAVASFAKREEAIDANFFVRSFESTTMANIPITTITLLSVAVRMYVRLHMLGQFNSEDWAMVVTTVLYIVQSGLTYAVSSVGKQYFSGDASVMGELTQLSRFGNAFFALTTIALKFSLGFFFLRIIGHKKPQRYTIYALLVLTTVVGMIYFGLAGFTCAQVKDVKGLSATPCPIQRTSTVIFSAFSVINMASDFIMTGIALWALWKAQIPPLTKMIASILLGLGCVGGLASVMRLVIVLQPTDIIGYFRSLFRSGLWLSIELAMGIIAANLAMVRPLLQWCLQKMHLVSTRTGTTTTPGGVRTSKSAFGTRPGTSKHSEARHGEAVLLDEIRKETVVTVSDEEKGSMEQEYGGQPVRPRQI